MIDTSAGANEPTAKVWHTPETVPVGDGTSCCEAEQRTPRKSCVLDELRSQPIRLWKPR